MMTFAEVVDGDTSPCADTRSNQRALGAAGNSTNHRAAYRRSSNDLGAGMVIVVMMAAISPSRRRQSCTQGSSQQQDCGCPFPIPKNTNLQFHSIFLRPVVSFVRSQDDWMTIADTPFVLRTNQ